MAITRTSDVLKNFKYRVIISNSKFPFSGAIGFSSVTGLSDETEVIEYREVTDASYPIKLVGVSSVGDVTLERGITTSEDGIKMADWRYEVKQLISNKYLTGMEFIRSTVRIIVMGEGQNEAATWELQGAWPSALTIGDLDASSSDVLMETVTFAAEKITRLR